MSSLKLNLIAACDAKMGIGKNNDLPWKLKKEMAYFNRLTTGKLSKDPGSSKKNAVVMGRKTYDSIPEQFRPLKKRLNVVLSRDSTIEPKNDIVPCKSWDEAMEYLAQAQADDVIDQVWVIGGSHIYKEAIESPFCHRIYLTRIHEEFDCDTLFPQFDESAFTLIKDPEVLDDVQEEDGLRYKFEVYEKI